MQDFEGFVHFIEDVKISKLLDMTWLSITTDLSFLVHYFDISTDQLHEMSLHNSHSVLTSLIILYYRAYIRLINQLVIQTNEHQSLVIGSQVDRDKYRCEWG